MSSGAFFGILALLIGVAAIWFIWATVTGNGPEGDDDVRRIDMGTNAYAAQQAHGELTEAGLTTRIVTLESGAFGIGMGEQYFIVYNTEDEAAVRPVAERYLRDLDDDGLINDDAEE